MNYAGKQEQRQVKAISSIEVVDVQGVDPEDLFYELKTTLGSVICNKYIDGEHQGSAGKQRTYPFYQLLVLSWNKEDQQKPAETAEQDGGKIRKIGNLQAHPLSP
jgi:hypothetical protein